jgi:hypothetical protein
MTLTEEDKKRIEEEEAYRQKVREGSVSEKVEEKPKKKGIGCLTLVVLLILLGIGMSVIPNGQQQSSQPENTTVSQDNSVIKEGKLLNDKYSYQILKKGGDKNYYAIFTPFLADDTQVVTLAVMTIVSDVYGSDVFLNNKPNVSEYEGFTFIQIPYKGENIVVTPVSENRQIHSIIMWKE